MLPSSSQNKRYLLTGEEDDLLRKEKIRRRNARLSQTRNIANENELKITKAVILEKTWLLDRLGSQLRAEWVNEKAVEISTVGGQYGDCLIQMGEGHQNVDFDEARIEILKEKLSQDQVKSTFRGKSALEEQKSRQRLTQEATNRKQDLRKKMYVYGNRVGEVLRVPPRTELPIHIEKENYCPANHVANLTVDNDEIVYREPDARLAAEEENKRHLESEQDYSKHKLNQNNKTQERYLLAIQKLHKEKEMNEFIKKIEEIDDLSQSSVNASDMEKEREKAVEKLFENLGLPVKLSFSESSISGLTTDASSTVGGSHTPAHIILPRRRLDSSRTSVNNEISKGVSELIPSRSSSTPNFTPTIGSKSRSSYYTDDEKKQLFRSKFNESETILAGNLQSPVSTINFTESTSITLTSTDKSSIGYPLTRSSGQLISDSTVGKRSSINESVGLLNSNLKDKNTNLVEPIYHHADELLTSNQEGADDKIAENIKIEPESDSICQMNEDLELLKAIHSSRDLNKIEPGVFHNVVIRKKDGSSVLSSAQLDKVNDERKQHLQNIVAKTIQSKKGFETLVSQATKKTSSDELLITEQSEKSESETNLSSKLGLLSPPKSLSVKQIKPLRLRRQNLEQELSTIIEMDTPRSSLISDCHISHIASTPCGVGKSDSLFDYISDSEIGILEERTMTLVSSITSYNSDQPTADELSSTKAVVPFIVTNVTVKTKSSTAELGKDHIATRANISSASSAELNAGYNERLGSQNLWAGHSYGHTPTIDSLSLHSCLSSSKSVLTHLSPLSLSQNSRSLTSNSKSTSNVNTNSSDEPSVTDDHLSNSLISFLAHEMSASSEIDYDV